MRKVLLFAAMLSLAFLLACGDSKEEVEEQSFEITADEKVADDDVVMVLNGEEITGDRYNLVYLQMKLQLFQYGGDISDLEEVKDLAMEALIEQELLQQEARDKGVEVSDKELEKELKAIKDESGETFDEYLEEFFFDEESYKAMLSYAMLYDKYVTEQLSDIEVSDDELQEAYDELKENNEEIADFEEIKESLRIGLTRQKESEVVQDRIAALKEKAEIEKKI